jgi:spore germination protein KA
VERHQLTDVRRACDRADALIAQLEGQLPQPGEPAVLYLARARLGSDDLDTVRVDIPSGEPVWVSYVRTAVDRTRVYEEVFRPLQELPRRGAPDPVAVLPRARPLASPAAGAQRLAEGAVLVVAGGRLAAVDLQAFPRRPVEAPSTEQTVLGSKQGFTEDLESNVGAIRSRLRDPSLRVEIFRVGKRSHTQVALAYLADVANPDLLTLTRKGMAAIDTDFVRTGNDVVEALYGRTWTTVPMTEETERVDRVATAIAAGRLCLVISGTPFAVLVPTTVVSTLMDSETTLQGPLNVSFVRLVRLLGELLAISSPGLYVALLTAATQVLPTPLVLAVASSRAGVPYPVLTETLGMLLIIDVFSEATSQAPGGIGNTLSIVGTLIIGQMVVQAHLASSLMMIVVATTALGAFLTLKYPFSYTLRIWKYPITLLAGLAGLFGWLCGLLLLLTHLAVLKSAGVPYLAPLGPYRGRTLRKHVLTQALHPHLVRRPSTWNPRQLDRAGPRR